MYFCLNAAIIIADTKPTKPAIKSSTLPRTSSQGNKLFCETKISTTSTSSSFENKGTL